jgi:uncharacterized protein
MCTFGNCTVPDLFDVVGGVSIGGFLASALVYPSHDDSTKVKWTTKDILDQFTGWAHTIFHQTWSHWLLSGFGYIQSKYTSQSFFQLLEKEYGSITMENTLRPFLCFTYDLDKKKPRCLSSWKYPTMQIQDAVFATTAAPSYFPPYTLKYDGHQTIDGGTVANNPCNWMTILVRKYMTDRDPHEPIHVTSIGTGTAIQKQTTPTFSGLFPWINDIFNIMFDANEQLQWYSLYATIGGLLNTRVCHDKPYECTHVHHKSHTFVRWNPKLDESIALDDIGKLGEIRTIVEAFIQEHREEIERITMTLLKRKIVN